MKQSIDLEPLDRYLLAIIAQMEPRGRRALLKKIITYLRRSTAKRITAQKNPDGSRWEPRKKQLRSKRGRIRNKKMMLGLRNSKQLRLKVSTDKAELGYTGAAARIARVHQEGAVDRVAKGGPLHRYAQRKILGVSRSEREGVRDLVIGHLSDSR